MDQGAWTVRSLIFWTVAVQLMAVTVAAPTANLIPSLPGQPQVSFKQYSGYITVDQSHGRKLFYYFAEAANSSATAPLVLWLNGGPGCSSLTGAFSELGPFYPNISGESLILNDYGWNQVANIIFLESPAGVGFSYSNDPSDYITGDDQTAQDALAFLLGWLSEYPEYNSTDFYITGESYAGHYIPQLAAAILKNNKIAGQAQIQVKGIMAGNPLFDETIDLEYAPYEYAWGHGMVDEDTHDVIVKECNYSASSRNAACQDAENTTYYESNNQYINSYDVLEDVCLTSGQQAFRLKAFAAGMKVTVDPCITDEMTTYLNLTEVEKALHTEVTGWTQCSNSISYNYTDRSIPMAPILAQLVNSNLTVWIFSGDADMVVPVIGTRKIINTLAKSLKINTTSTYQPWFQGSQIGGWTVSWRRLVYSTVRGAGHMVAGTQPARALQLFTSFLAGDATPPLAPM